MQAIGRYRWVIVTLLFFATTINYLDRQVIGLLKDYLARDLHWSEKDYGRIVTAFSAAYAIGLVVLGRMTDRIGTRAGYTVSVTIWSLAAIAHAFVTTTLGFGAARTTLGLGEGGNFPAAIKVVAEWFPKKERAFATGIFNSGSNIAAVIGPFLVMWIYYRYGWQAAFIWTGSIGFVWLIFWAIFYAIPARQRWLTRAEYEYISSDEVDGDAESGGRERVMSLRQTWALITGRFFTDPVWWFYLFWIPSYLNTTFSLNLQSSWVYVSIIYIVASLGSILGGYLSGWLIKNGWEVYKARKAAMLLYALCVVPVIFIRFTTSIGAAVSLISLAAAAHQAWGANIFTVVSDVFPKSAVSTVVGISGMGGCVGGILFPLMVGRVLEHFRLLGQLRGGYDIVFIFCGSLYLVAWVLMHLISPKMEARGAASAVKGAGR
ncbi:MAG TPA: MFS transporter [Puia sp.]|nr:MFS transporter [Puia sp.]